MNSDDNDANLEFPLEIEPANTSIPDQELSLDELLSLEIKKQSLEQEIKSLEAIKQERITQTADIISQMLKESLLELESRKQKLELSIEQLEKRREKIKEEMRTTFAGASQDLAIRVQGFKDYLVGSLQDLAAAAEKLDLKTPKPPKSVSPPTIDSPTFSGNRSTRIENSPSTILAGGSFAEYSQTIKGLLEQYRTSPDYYGPSWQLRRTFDAVHAERVQKWFFNQGGRGTIRSTGSKLQNILIASATISILHDIYRERARALILVGYPERLGEWRRGLQDCLGISRSDFGPDRGVALFEAPEALIQKAERLIDEGQMPVVILDETEEQVNVGLLQFPLWLAFSGDPQQSSGFNY